ncbi:hypothetical protein UNDYM_2282 [Undibacterium sp. YM2]|uniref:hypothetical protein n=1 Tax=Undibacterium sp. YM2 TaxID=2058625 RepID=UPI001331DDAB|nr:hypothetical protein [Undibacterium sp. YM2]BBB66535.1 hypothetical protein UNDYM_2282 [Undibacterium sp. YM2]
MKTKKNAATKKSKYIFIKGQKNLIKDVRGQDGRWLTSVTIDGVKCHTQGYRMYSAMIGRCHKGWGRFIKQKAYSDVKMFVEWMQEMDGFQKFVTWANKQKGYRKGYSPDKDLMGSKAYSPDTVCFIPTEINGFLVEQSRGKLPAGVHVNGKGFRVKQSIDGKNIYYGTFPTIAEASAKYASVKEARAKELAEKWKTRISKAAYEALIAYKVPAPKPEPKPLFDVVEFLRGRYEAAQNRQVLEVCE